ncbi:unnamed protein product [Protopolystoma xenopodis]|uniref:Uncharacterized protein n=1 Tax=Protopolystoma xenopodis TaxID=117903 RepID=A0A448XES1_9PLAT|nr:unnamed protein product [Protopolystoma xenopodis]
MEQTGEAFHGRATQLPSHLSNSLISLKTSRYTSSSSLSLPLLKARSLRFCSLKGNLQQQSLLRPVTATMESAGDIVNDDDYGKENYIKDSLEWSGLAESDRPYSAGRVEERSEQNYLTAGPSYLQVRGQQTVPILKTHRRELDRPSISKTDRSFNWSPNVHIFCASREVSPT